jgi:hypothetical protein
LAAACEHPQPLEDHPEVEREDQAADSREEPLPLEVCEIAPKLFGAGDLLVRSLPRLVRFESGSAAMAGQSAALEALVCPRGSITFTVPQP